MKLKRWSKEDGKKVKSKNPIRRTIMKINNFFGKIEQVIDLRREFRLWGFDLLI